MLAPHPRLSSFQRLTALGLVATAALLGAPATANAHFVLAEPAATMAQDSLGSPQKMAPCGDDGTGMPSGKVTAYQAGQTITITIDEKIYHPGHYRISLGVNGPGDIPVEPVVTPGANTPCGTAPVEATPTFPVLADGVFEHQAPFDKPQSITITLPPNVTCEHCTLQVLEFMSNHPLNNPGGCYYHHCADISIQASGGVTTGAGSTTTSTGAAGGADATSSTSSTTGGAGGESSSSTSSGGESSGCRFNGAAPTSPGLGGLAGLVALAALALRRRRA